jgi:predicted DNA-binding protein (UPF0251 family)
MPGLTYFKPAGVPFRLLGEIRLSIEEVEAIRLKDIDDLDQEQCAGKMNISRPTFQRVLESARKKIADALLNGKAVRIEGGNFEVAPLHFRCLNDHEWDVQPKTMGAEVPLCPTCSTQAIMESSHRGAD